LHGWVYDIETGEVNCYDAKSNKFVPIKDWYKNYLEAKA